MRQKDNVCGNCKHVKRSVRGGYLKFYVYECKFREKGKKEVNPACHTCEKFTLRKEPMKNNCVVANFNTTYLRKEVVANEKP